MQLCQLEREIRNTLRKDGSQTTNQLSASMLYPPEELLPALLNMENNGYVSSKPVQELIQARKNEDPLLFYKWSYERL